MSGSSYNSSRSATERYDSLRSDDYGTRERVYREHRAKVEDAREKINRGEVSKPPTVNRNVNEVVDPTCARNKITRPSKEAQRVVVVVTDNSGSNSAIAENMRNSSGYFTAFLRTVDPGAEAAFIYFSDHGDGSRMLQCTDFISPSPTGDKVLYNSLRNVSTAHGQDLPEAIECALAYAAELDFGHVQVKDRTLVLVTDSVAHGMGHPDDDGCPHQVDWRNSMRAVRETYGKFILVGSGNDPGMTKYQQKFFERETQDRGNGAGYVLDKVDMALNFIDLSDIKSAVHRNGIVVNSILFVLSRNQGKQGIPVFLAALYSKWLANPVFGERTDELARHRIRHMAETYLQGLMTREEIQTMLRDILAE
jgi:hypothetical protein